MDNDEYKLEKTKVLGMLDENMYKQGMSRSATPTDALRAARFRTTYRTAYPAAQPPHAVDSRRLQLDPLEPGGDGVKKERVDFLLRQLRQICYRKVRGHGNDVSVREIFRHFDSVKDSAGEAGIDEAEFVQAVQRLMLGNARDGMITKQEAHCLFRRLDENDDHKIDYREIASNLSAPGWDARFLGTRSNILL